MQLLIFLTLTATLAFADHVPEPYAPPPPLTYKRPPTTYKEPERYDPQPYEYKYGVEDQYSGTSFDKNENQSPDGVTTGSYRVNLPDGRVQVVSYTVDAYNGYVADVRYEGEAVYPDPPKDGYGKASYHPAPRPKYAPAPAPTYKAAPAYRPAPAYKPAPVPAYKPAPVPAYKSAPAPVPAYAPTPTPKYKPAAPKYAPVVPDYIPEPKYVPGKRTPEVEGEDSEHQDKDTAAQY